MFEAIAFYFFAAILIAGRGQSLSSVLAVFLEFWGGYVVARGFIFGRPAIQAYVGALRFVLAVVVAMAVADHVSGRLIRPGAVHQFAEALKAYVEEPDLRGRHGAAGNARSRQFSWDRINQAVADTYVRLIRQKGMARA